MGAKSSKPVAQAKFATRKFPTRPAGLSPAAAAVRPPPRGATPSAQSQQQYPQRQAQAGAAASPVSRPRVEQASFTKDDAIRKDGSDPDFDPDPNHHTDAAFSQRLRQMGVATPNPTLSNSSIVNAQGSFAQQQQQQQQNNNTTTRTNTATTTTFGQNPSLLSSKQQPSPPTSSADKPTSSGSSSALGRAGDRSRPFPAAGSGSDSGPSSTATTTLNALQVRRELAERAQHEFERGGNVDREFLDVNTLRQIIALVEQRQQGGSGTGTRTTSKAGAGADMSAAEAAQIEKRLNLKQGVVGKLVGGKAKGVFGTVNV